MSCWKLGSMVRINGLFHLYLSMGYIGVISHLLPIPSNVWYILLHLVDFYGFHVGKYNILYMDGMGYIALNDPNKPVLPGTSKRCHNGAHSRGRSYHGGSTSSLGATGDFRRRFAESNTHGAFVGGRSR